MANQVANPALNIQTVDLHDEHAIDSFHEALFDAGQEQVLNDFRRLREMGLVDAEGNQLKTVIPADMMDPEADFGG